MIRRIVSLRVLACDRRCRRRLCGDICVDWIVLQRATFLLTTDLLLPLWRGLIYVRLLDIGDYCCAATRLAGWL